MGNKQQRRAPGNQIGGNMKVRNDDELILSMAGKIFAPIASSTANCQAAVRQAREILTEVDSQIDQPTNQGQLKFFAQTRNKIAEVAATIIATQLAKSA